MDADSSSAGVELELMLTAELPTPSAYVYRAEGENLARRLLAVVRPGASVLRSPSLAYAVRHPSAGTILIDTGMHPDVREHLRRDFGPAMSVVFRNMRAADEPFDAQLRALDIEPSEVKRVIMTHLHVDHTSGMRLLPDARFICSGAEWAATGQRFAAGKGYVSHHLPDATRMQLVDFERDAEAYATFAQTLDLFGDGSIRLISTPGHTVGHLSVLLRLKSGRQVLVVGDAAYTLRNIREQILPMLTDDDEASLRSIGEIRAFGEREPTAVIVPSHDPTAWHALRELSVSAAALAPTS